MSTTKTGYFMKLHLRKGSDTYAATQMACAPGRKRVLALSPVSFRSAPEDEKCSKCCAVYAQRVAKAQLTKITA